MKEILQNLSMEPLKCISPVFWYIIGGIAIIYIVYLSLKPRWISIYKSDEGCVSLTKSSLNKIIESLARDVGIRDKVYTKIKCCRGNISIDITIRIGRRQNLADISRSLRETLQNVLTHNIGLEAVKKVNIIVAEFQPENSNCKCLCQKESSNREIFNSSNDQTNNPL
ncbi:MAG: hypothetical protein LBQ23_04155 [Puniceicoccales bacterium]|jgi:uncharacterized alkaline shock family protein YloU|nr:hypothetical protein [Puniceicoccales bacterium]